MTILIVIATLVGATFLIYQLHKYIKEKNEDAEQSITIENFANVYFDDEYEDWFDSEEERANRLSIEMLEDELINKDDYDDFLLDLEDENDNFCEDEIDYFDEEEFLSKFYDVETEKQPTKVISN